MYLVPPVFARLTELAPGRHGGDCRRRRRGGAPGDDGPVGFVHATIKRFDEDQARQARITRLPGDAIDNSRENS